MKQDLETMLYKPLCHHGFKVLCAMYCVSGGAWLLTLSLHCSPPSLDPVCSSLCSNCHNCLLARHVILHDFLWHVQCMVHGSRALGWFNKLFFEPIGTSPNPAIDWVNRAPQVCREPSSSEPPVLSKARFASCTGQVHDTACSTEHVLLHPVLPCSLGPNS